MLNAVIEHLFFEQLCRAMLPSSAGLLHRWQLVGSRPGNPHYPGACRTTWQGNTSLPVAPDHSPGTPPAVATEVLTVQILHSSCACLSAASEPSWPFTLQLLPGCSPRSLTEHVPACSSAPELIAALATRMELKQSHPSLDRTQAMQMPASLLGNGLPSEAGSTEHSPLSGSVTDSGDQGDSPMARRLQLPAIRTQGQHLQTFAQPGPVAESAESEDGSVAGSEAQGAGALPVWLGC